VHPQKVSRDARCLFERLKVRQTRVRARRESQHAAQDKGHEEENKDKDNTVSSRQKGKRGELARNENHRDTRHERDMKETRSIVVQREAAEDGSRAEA
jgi:hypothetical protein